MIEALAVEAGATPRSMAPGIGIFFATNPFEINGVTATKFTRTGWASPDEALGDQAGIVADGSVGAWYRLEIAGREFEGSLCPAALKYFSVHPETLYALVDLATVQTMPTMPDVERWKKHRAEIDEAVTAVHDYHPAKRQSHLKEWHGTVSDAIRFAETMKQRFGPSDYEPPRPRERRSGRR